MPRPKVPSRPRAWPRVAVLALVGVAVAGCENSARFDSNPFASNSPPRPEYTGSITQRPAAHGAVSSQPLPAPGKPATVAAYGGVATGAHGLAAYRPGAPEYTGSVTTHHAAAPAPAGHWTWDGGQPVTVGYGETMETVARKNGVPLSALMQVNGITNAASIRPGQRLVIPRYVAAGAEHAPAAAAAPASTVAENVHIVEPGESMMGIARRHGVTLSALARANNMQPYTKINIGDRLTIPGGARVSARRAPAPQLAQPRTVPAPKVASVQTQNARVAKPEVHETESVTRSAEPAGAIPSFRWPVKGRIIAGFGARPNGTQNDGINLAVPEGTPIKAADDGVVAYAGNELKGYGNLVLIRHAGGYVSAYANAKNITVKRGDAVKRGQVIAHAGQTGNVTSPQLHFEIRKGSTPVDPTKYLSGA
jgi:murein DD-endopeptidase MepM/ murein hydrolase activator NlpD